MLLYPIDDLLQVSLLDPREGMVIPQDHALLTPVDDIPPGKFFKGCLVDGLTAGEVHEYLEVLLQGVGMQGGRRHEERHSL